MGFEDGWVVGTETGTADGAPPLHRSLGECLLELGQLARSHTPDDFLRAAMLALRRQVAFDAAWWGEVSRGTDGASPRNLLHDSIGLSPTFAEEWNRELADIDNFALGTISNLGAVFRASGGYPGPPGVVAAFIERHALHGIMTMTVELPDSGVLFFICLYLNDPRAGFTDAQSAFFSDFTRHLAQAWQHRIADLLRTTSATSGAALAVADSAGRLHYLGQEIGAVLARSDAAWPGSMLPAELIAAFGRAPCAIELAGARLVLEPMGQLMAVIVDDGDMRRSALPPRELSAALLFAQGHTNKEIARLLCLSPSTVRTYLRDAYRRLGVSNKVGLIAALGRQQ